MMRLIRGLRLAGCALLIAVALLMSADAGLRYLFSSPIFGAQDLLSTGLLLVFVLGLADSWLARSHVRMDMIYDRFPRPVRAAVDVMILVIGVVFAGSLCYGGIHAFRQFSGYGAATPLLGIPHAFLAAVVAFGALCFAAAILFDAYLKLTGRELPASPPAELG